MFILKKYVLSVIFPSPPPPPKPVDFTYPSLEEPPLPALSVVHVKPSVAEVTETSDARTNQEGKLETFKPPISSAKAEHLSSIAQSASAIKTVPQVRRVGLSLLLLKLLRGKMVSNVPS